MPSRLVRSGLGWFAGATAIGPPPRRSGSDATSLATPTFHGQTRFAVTHYFGSFPLASSLQPILHTFVGRLLFLSLSPASLTDSFLLALHVVASPRSRKRDRSSLRLVLYRRASPSCSFHPPFVRPSLGDSPIPRSFRSRFPTPATTRTLGPPTGRPATRSPAARPERAPPSRITPRPRERSVTTKVLVKS